MSVSAKVKATLQIAGKKQIELAQNFHMEKQTMSNKMARDSWSASDLIKVAEFTGCKLAFVWPNGSQTIMGTEDIKEGKSSKKGTALDADTSKAEE